jgi:pimeloyl-ACP methyl ester carboxylesterase
LPSVVPGNGAPVDGYENDRTQGFPEVPGVEHRFLDAAGLRMHVAEAGDGEPIVMLHGWPQHWYLWRGVIPLLAPHARVICADLRGFGWTDVPTAGYSPETMARDVLALLDELGLERVRLVGHDWGGWIGFLLCLNEPDRIGRFVALGVVPPWPSRDLRAMLHAWRITYQIPLSLPYIGRLAVERGLARLTLRGGGPFHEEDLEAFTRRLTGDRARATESLYRNFLLRDGPAVAAGRYARRTLEVPTLLVVGERDPVIPARLVRDQAARVEALDVEIVPGAGHFIVDERPELVSDRVLRFFAFGATSQAAAR